MYALHIANSCARHESSHFQVCILCLTWFRPIRPPSHRSNISSIPAQPHTFPSPFPRFTMPPRRSRRGLWHASIFFYSKMGVCPRESAANFSFSIPYFRSFHYHFEAFFVGVIHFVLKKLLQDVFRFLISISICRVSFPPLFCFVCHRCVRPTSSHLVTTMIRNQSQLFSLSRDYFSSLNLCLINYFNLSSQKK